ncbi:unnamed protein product, partial [Scytosiphon promiscuus]
AEGGAQADRQARGAEGRDPSRDEHPHGDPRRRRPRKHRTSSGRLRGPDLLLLRARAGIGRRDVRAPHEKRPVLGGHRGELHAGAGG